LYSLVGIAICYGLDGLGIKSQWGARLSAPLPTSRGAHPACNAMGSRSFLGVKQPGHAIDHSFPSSTEVKERMELYLYSPIGPSWPILG